jgi:hypothetical protein
VSERRTSRFGGTKDTFEKTRAELKEKEKRKTKRSNLQYFFAGVAVPLCLLFLPQQISKLWILKKPNKPVLEGQMQVLLPRSPSLVWQGRYDFDGATASGDGDEKSAPERMGRFVRSGRKLNF